MHYREVLIDAKQHLSIAVWDSAFKHQALDGFLLYTFF